MTVPLLDLSTQHKTLLPELRERFERIVSSGRFILGPFVDDLEQRLSQYCNTRHSLGVSSGTDALLLAMMAMDIGAGDEVITTPFTFFCTAGCIARLGARPVFVDIEPATFNLDVNKLEAAITPRTKAIIPVHLYGQAADMKSIMAIARRHGVRVLEDAAQAIGARDGEHRVGSLGDVAAFSFYPTKNLAGLGDAGALTTNNPELHERMRMLRVHGEEQRYHHALVGGNFRIDAMQAAFLTVKMPWLDQWTAARRRHAQRYQSLLAGLPLVTPTDLTGGHVFNQFTLRVPSKDGGGERRDAFRRHLAAHGIGHEVYYPVPLHLQKCFANLGHKLGDFPEAERASREVVSLPVFPELSEAQQDEVVRVIRGFHS